MAFDARQRFKELIARPQTEIPLFETALVIAAESYQGLDIKNYLKRLEAMTDLAQMQVEGSSSDEALVARLNSFFFNELGFEGDRENYFDPKNSYINEVMDRRKGLPLTLALIYMEIAKSLKLHVEGVGFPGHFLMRFVGHEEILIDPFYGAVLTQKDCETHLKTALGEFALFDKRFLQPSTPHEILIRLLANLKNVYLRLNQFEAALSFVDRILMISPAEIYEIRDRGLLYLQLECFTSAKRDFERFLSMAPNDVSAPLIREQLETTNQEVEHIS